MFVFSQFGFGVWIMRRTSDPVYQGKKGSWDWHCAKSVPIRSCSGPHFPTFGMNTERNSITENFMKGATSSLLHRESSINNIHSATAIASRLSWTSLRWFSWSLKNLRNLFLKHYTVFMVACYPSIHVSFW